MPDRPLADLEALVGRSATTVEDFPIAPVKIAEFADATRDDDPVYRDPDVAERRGYDRIPAPLPFAWSGSVRPAYGPPDRAWPGFDLGFDWSRTLHGEQRYSFERPLLAGDHLTGTATVTDVGQREGRRGGTMTVVEFETVFRDGAGDRVVTEETTLIEVGAVQAGRDEPPEDVSLAEEREAADYVRVVEDVTRVDFVRWAGAVGDFARPHIDEPYAREIGYESVFGQGMLTAAHAAVLVTDWASIRDVTAFASRFTGVVFPGDTLTVLGTEGEPGTVDGQAIRDLDLSVRTDDGSEVMTGTATAGE